MIVKVLINALGITDSGGIVVLDKALAECTADKSIKIFIVCNFNDHIRKLTKCKATKANLSMTPTKVAHYSLVNFD